MSRRSGARHPTAKLKGGWSPEEDGLLTRLVKKFGEGNWSPIARALNEATGKTETTGRIGKQCRERWNHHLSPGLRKDPWTPEEEVMVVDAHKRLGNRWSDIARCIPGRSENAVKNHWNATLRKRVTPDNPAGPLKEYLDTLNLSVTPRKRGSGGGGGGVKRKRGAGRDSDCTSDEAEPDLDAPNPTPTPDSRATSPSRAWTAAAAATTTAATPTKSRARSGVTTPVAALATATIATALGGRDGGGGRDVPTGGEPVVAAAAAPPATATVTAGPSIGTPVRREGAVAATVIAEDTAVAAAGPFREAADAAVVDMYDNGSVNTAATGGVSSRRRSRRLAAQVGTERLRNLVEAERREKEEEAAELEYDNGRGGDGGSSESKSSEVDAEVEVAAARVASHGAGAVQQGPQEPSGCQGGPFQAESICGSALPTQIAGSSAAVAGVGPPTPATAEREIPVAARPVGASPFSRGAVRAAIAAVGLPCVGLGREPSTAGSAMLPPALPALPRLPVLPSLRTVVAPSPPAAGPMGAAAAEREPPSPLHGAAGGGGGWSFPYNWSTNNIQMLATEEILPRVALGTPRGGKVRPPAANGATDIEAEGAAEAAASVAAATAADADAAAEAAAVQHSGGSGAASGDTVHAGGSSAAGEGVAAAAAVAAATTVTAAAVEMPREPSLSCPPPLRPSAQEDETCLFLTPGADFSASMCHMRHVASGSALLSYETAAAAQPPAAMAAATVTEQRQQQDHPHPSQQQYHMSPFATAAASNAVVAPIVFSGDDAGRGEAAAPTAAANARTGAAAAGGSVGGYGGACALQAPCPFHWQPRLAVATPPVRTWTPPNLFDEPHLDFGCPDSPLLDAADVAVADADADAGVAVPEDDRPGADDAAVAAAAAAGIACDSSISSVGSPLSHVREYGDSGAGAQQEVAGFFWGNRTGTSGGGTAAAAGAGTGIGEVMGPPGYLGSTTVSPVAASAVLKRESSFSGCSFVPPPALGCAPPQHQQQPQQPPSAPHHAPAFCHPSSPWGNKGAAVQPLPTAPASPAGWPSAMLPPAAAAAATTAPPVQTSYVIGYPVLPPPYMWHPGAPMPPPPTAAATPTAPPPPLHPHPHYGVYGGLPLVPPGAPQPLHPHAAGASVPPYPFVQGSLPPATAQPGSGQQQQQLPQPQQPSLCRQEPVVPFPPLAQTRPEERQQQQQQLAPKTADYPEYGTSYVAAPGPFYYSWTPYPSYGGLHGCMPYHATPGQVTGVPVGQAQPPAAPFDHAHRLAMQPQPAPQPQPPHLHLQEQQHLHLQQHLQASVGSFAGGVAALPSVADLPRLSCTTVPQVAE